MSNINVRIVGTANFKQPIAAAAAYETEIAAANAQLARMVELQNGVDGRGFERAAAGAAANSKFFKSAAASTGMFHTETVRVNNAADDYIEKLRAQKMSFRDLMRERTVGSKAYRQLLAQEAMQVRKVTDIHGRQMLDVTYPKQISSQMHSAGKEAAFFNEQMRSGAKQMVNWGKNTQWAGRQLMVGLTMPIVAFGAAAGVMAYKVDQELTRIIKVYDFAATTVAGKERQMTEVREASFRTATKAAEDYGQSVTDTLSVEAELAATGKTGSGLQESTTQVMRIARLGEIEYQDALQATISLQSVFRMSNEDLTKSFNYMNSVENATSLSTKDFAQAIPIAAAPIKQFGGDIQELGILLTAMKERGIEATQGANAIKAAMQRLGRPSKQIQEEFTAMTGADITKIFDQSKNLTEIFTAINEVTRDMSKQDKTKVFAGLFGSYQVTRMSALVEGMEDLKNGVGQVSQAYRIAQDAPSKWADVAETEMERYKESVSGQFQRTLQTLGAQLAEMGVPFVVVATQVLKFINVILDGFNAMPKFSKVIIGAGIAAAALAGGLLMLTGLFANLIGQGIGFVGAINAKLLPGLSMMTTKQRAAQLAANEASEGMLTERSAAAQLTMELEALAFAQAEANARMLESTRASTTAAGAYTARTSAQGATTNVGTAGMIPTVMTGSTGSFINVQGQKVAAKDIEASMKNQVAEQKKLSGAAMATAGWMALGAVSMIGMNKATSEGKREFFEYLMYASMIAPALIAAASAAKGLYATIKAGEIATGRWAVAGKAVGFMFGGLTKVIFGLGRALQFMFLNPLGLAILAVTAIAVVLLKIWHDHREAQKEAWRQQNALTNSTEDWADATGVARKNYERIAVVGLPGSPKMEANLEEDYKYYDEEPKGQEFIAGLKDRDSMQQDRIMMQKLIEMQTQYGLTAARSKQNVTAAFMALGYGADQARFRVETLVREMGGLKDTDWVGVMENAGQVMADALDPGRLEDMSPEGEASTIKNQVNKYADMWSAAMANAKTPAQANAIFDELDQVTMTRWDALLAEMRNRSGGLADFLTKEGVNSGKELSKWWRKNSKEFDYQTMLADFGIGEGETVIWQQMAEGADQFEASVIGNIRELNRLNKGISTTTELQNDYNVQASLLTYKGAVRSVKQLAREMLALKADAALGEAGGMGKGFMNLNAAQKEMAQFATLTDEQKNQFQATMEAFANANNIKLGKTALQTYHNILNNVKNTTDKVTDATKKWAQAVKYTASDLAGVRQTAMQGVQQDIADDITEAFDQRMSNALEARQNMWDRRADQLSKSIENRQNALQAEFDKREQALDAKWENKTDRATEYWDNRVKHVEHAIEVEQKAEEMRQKMFEAEIARINKLNEAQNRNIDFNVALNTGQFDEAAKIRNDATAGAAQTALERAAAAGAAGSEKRVGKLEDRRDNIEDARDDFMKDLEKREQAERRHLDHLRQMQERALDKQSDRQTKHLEDMTEADMEAQNDIWENRKESLEDQLELFVSFIARNKKELQQHMKDVGISYHDFGENVLKPKGENWATYFGERMQHHIRAAGNALKSDKMWEELGKSSVNQMLKGMGFNSMAAFKNFIKTGEWKSGSSKNKQGGNNSGKNGHTTSEGAGRPPPPSSSGDDRHPNLPRSTTGHEGGPIGSAGMAKSSRKGVARTLGGLHPSEQMIRAQKGEYLVNRDAAAQHGDVLDKINSGRNTYTPHPKPRAKNTGGAGPFGTAAFASGVLAAGFMQGVHTALQNKKHDRQDQNRAERRAARAASGSGYTPGQAGMYSDRSFSKGQLKNAAIIASAGADMGMSKRDIEIGIMTAITESGLVNVHYGDLDSLGLFQQRSSWGSVDQRTNPEWAAKKFFSVLKTVGNRDALSPWMAAQTVQRSAFSDGSNYHQYWDNAKAIFNKGLAKAKDGKGYVAGAGGSHRPINAPVNTGRGIHDGEYGWPALDFSAGRGTPVYAVGDGHITRSYDIAGPLASDTYNGDGPYGSYGRVVYLKPNNGPEALYAHLQSRAVHAGQRVKGGAIIGHSGSTGNSSGPHLHFGVKSPASPYTYLKEGAANVRFDNTIANLHHGEAVLTKDLNRKFHQGVDNFANGGGNVYNIKVYGDGADAEAIADKVMTKIKRLDDRKPRNRRG